MAFHHSGLIISRKRMWKSFLKNGTLMLFLTQGHLVRRFTCTCGMTTRMRIHASRGVHGKLFYIVAFFRSAIWSVMQPLFRFTCIIRMGFKGRSSVIGEKALGKGCAYYL